MEEICRGDMQRRYTRDIQPTQLHYSTSSTFLKLVVHLPLPPNLIVGTVNHCDTLHSESDSRFTEGCIQSRHAEKIFRGSAP